MKTHSYQLFLFIAGGTALSLKAVSAIREICKTRIKGKFTLKIVDVFEDIDEARRHQVVATPTLIKVSPKPSVRIIGDLSDVAKVLDLLDISE